jgi:hypothetical protein
LSWRVPLMARRTAGPSCGLIQRVISPAAPSWSGGSRHKAPSRSGPMGAGGQRSPCVTASRDPNPAPSARRVSRTARGEIRGVQDFGVVRLGRGEARAGPIRRSESRDRAPRETRGRQGAMAGAPGGGPGPSGAAARICRTASGSSTVAITRSRPPQRRQANTSIANARRLRASQVQLRSGDGGPCRLSGALRTAASGAARP